jgi:type IV pilus assembly protein PilO
MQLSEMDLNNIGDWPLLAKALLVALACGLVGFGWYHFIISPQIERLTAAEGKEQTLRQDFERKQHKAANLEQYQQQLVEMEALFGGMLRQLPDETEVASLLVDVSQTGLAAGLEFERFEPANEVDKDFYAELPIRIRVSGRYHEFALFVSGLAALPRIVTVHNVEISGNERAQASTEERLRLGAIVKTYRYLDESAK